MDDLIKELTPEMLAGELYQQIAEAVGIDGFYKLGRPLASTSLSRADRGLPYRVRSQRRHHLNG